MSHRVLASLAAALCAVSWVALFASQGHPVVTLAPALVAVGFALLVMAPLRWTAAAMLAAALIVDIPAQRPAAGLWQSPLYPLGRALFENLHKITGIGALRLSLVDVLLLFLLALLAARRLRGVDSGGGGAPPSSLVTTACLAAVGGTFFAWAFGIAHGGDLRNSLWQVRPLLFAPLLALLFQEAFRGARGRRAVAVVVIASAILKAVIGLWVYLVVARPSGMRPSYVTSHADSLLYASVVTLIVSLWYEARTRLTWTLLLGMGPLLAAALYTNNRRLGWVCVAASLIVAALQARPTHLRRRLATLAVMMAPLALGYVAVGWSSDARAFKPVKVMRSILDRKDDRSSQTRDIENYNLTRTMRSAPLVGTGFGHEYREEVQADSIAAIFAQYRFIPHNSLLGLFAFAGLAGGFAMTLPVVVATFLAIRSRRYARDAAQRVAATTVAGGMFSYLLMAWGDMALQSPECAFLLATGIALVSSLSVEVGAWPSGTAGADVPLHGAKVTA